MIKSIFGDEDNKKSASPGVNTEAPPLVNSTNYRGVGSDIKPAIPVMKFNDNDSGKVVPFEIDGLIGKQNETMAGAAQEKSEGGATGAVQVKIEDKESQLNDYAPIKPITGEVAHAIETNADTAIKVDMDAPANPTDAKPEPSTVLRPATLLSEDPISVTRKDFVPDTPEEVVRKTGLAWSAAIALFTSVTFMLVLGWIADLLLGISPWGLVGGIVIGAFIGFVQFFRTTSQILKPSKPVVEPHHVFSNHNKEHK
ncbi:MAG: hypothetical protein ACK5NT_09620 [Pyrinomonadaceae bacterium]